jgi:hypothetical protein
MTDPSTTFTEPISTVNDLLIGRITENVISEEPPSYESILSRINQLSEPS